MIGDFGLYGGHFEFEWFQPNISVNTLSFASIGSEALDD